MEEDSKLIRRTPKEASRAEATLEAMEATVAAAGGMVVQVMLDTPAAPATNPAATAAAAAAAATSTKILTIVDNISEPFPTSCSHYTKPTSDLSFRHLAPFVSSLPQFIVNHSSRISSLPMPFVSSQHLSHSSLALSPSPWSHLEFGLYYYDS